MEIPTIFELASIGISKIERRREKGTYYEYAPFVVISSQNKEIIDLLYQLFPYAYRGTDMRGNTTIYDFEVKGKSKVRTLLFDILPYIETEKERWEYLWDFVNTYRTYPDEAEYYRSLVNRGR